jgi:ribosomal protein S18 acetylase RimI-like enzyme
MVLGWTAVLNPGPGSGSGYVGGVEVTSLGYRTDLMIRALEGSQVIYHPGYVTVRTPANPAFWWGNFVLLSGNAAREGAEPGLALMRSEFPAAAHVALGIDVTSAAAARLDDFAAAGLDVQQDTVLTAGALREPPHPNHAAVLRALASEHDWRQSAQLRAICDAEEGGYPAVPAFIAAREAARRTLAGTGHGAWFGAFLDGQLVSQLGVFSDGRGVARYQEVATHPDARRQGLAATLLCHAAQYATSHLAATTLVIVAEPAEPAIGVYRGVGFADRESEVSVSRAPS